MKWIISSAVGIGFTFYTTYVFDIGLLDWEWWGIFGIWAFSIIWHVVLIRKIK
jgi:hypothetical protein